MAFSEEERRFHEETIQWYLENNRPPENIRPKLDLGCRLEDQSVTIFEIRPSWRDKSQILEHYVAKATFIRTQDRWKVYWQRADLKWHGYEPKRYVSSLTEFFKLVEADKHFCFFG